MSEYIHNLSLYVNGVYQQKVKWTSKSRQRKYPHDIRLNIKSGSNIDVVSIEYERIMNNSTIKRIWVLGTADFDTDGRSHQCRCLIDRYSLKVTTIYNLDFSFMIYKFYWRRPQRLVENPDLQIGLNGRHPIPLPIEFYNLFPKYKPGTKVYCDRLWEKVNNVAILDYLIKNDTPRWDAINSSILAPVDVLERLLIRKKLNISWDAMELSAVWGKKPEIAWALDHIPKWGENPNRVTLLLIEAKNWHDTGRDNSALIDYLNELLKTLPPVYISSGKSKILDKNRAKASFIRKWFEIPPDEYLGRDTVGNSGLFNFGGVLTLCSLWPKGIDIDDLSREVLQFIAKHPALEEYNSWSEWKISSYIPIIEK